MDTLKKYIKKYAVLNCLSGALITGWVISGLIFIVKVAQNNFALATENAIVFFVLAGLIIYNEFTSLKVEKYIDEEVKKLCNLRE